MRPLATVQLFVYGSLKRGGRHHEELRGSRFLAAVRTAPGYELTTLKVGPPGEPGEPGEPSANEYHALVPAPGQAASVPGELFEVPVELLPLLDQFEGEDYVRKEVRLEPPAQAVGHAGSADAGHALGARRALAYFKNSR
ncbi:MAG: gamma-glutamylcyclotransferase [Myxococcales bacterium]|nr:MAG: gamma-glutamylcyclotransferase [Myxococcales bacterium]